MPVKRFIDSVHNINDGVHMHWLNGRMQALNGIDTKAMSDLSKSQENELNGYKSSLNESVVDDLVSSLTNKLCLKSKSCHSICKHNRMSPYQIHNSTIKTNSCSCLNCKYLINSNNTKRETNSITDTYELMQELLKEGSLIKEAVKRLQIGKDTTKKIDYYDYSDDEFGANENEINLLNS